MDIIFPPYKEFGSTNLRSSQIVNNNDENSGYSFFSIEDFQKSNKIFIDIKKLMPKPIYDELKKNNILILDIIDFFDKTKYSITTNNNEPNYLPNTILDEYDGFILTNKKMQDWWYFNIDRNRTKPTFVIPHHWDSRFEKLPIKKYGDGPYFYYLGSKGYMGKNCLYVKKLIEDNLLMEHRIDEKGPNYFIDRPINGVQINIRDKGSFEYCFKPATKILVAAAMESIIITTYDWSVQEILPENYPYLLKSTQYEDVKKMFDFVKQTFEKDEWYMAKKMLQDVKEKTSVDKIVPLYKEIENYFS